MLICTVWMSSVECVTPSYLQSLHTLMVFFIFCLVRILLRNYYKIVEGGFNFWTEEIAQQLKPLSV